MLQACAAVEAGEVSAAKVMPGGYTDGRPGGHVDTARPLFATPGISETKRMCYAQA